VKELLKVSKKEAAFRAELAKKAQQGVSYKVDSRGSVVFMTAKSGGSSK